MRAILSRHGHCLTMADIFISYSKADAALARSLAASLEAEGWIVWWDHSLNAGDIFRDAIVKQLSTARAVIVIWTKNSVRSDWVRAEAGRAKAEAKLIPVKTAELTYSDIPLPFCEMHTENITDMDLIRAATLGLLSKPMNEPSRYSLAWKTINSQLLMWIGTIGGSITVMTNLRGVLDLADWARLVVATWHEWTQVFWAEIFGWLGIRVPHARAPLLTFGAFIAMLALRARLAARNDSSLQNEPAGLYYGSALRLLIWLSTYVVLFTILYWALPPYDLESSRIALVRAAMTIAWLAPYGALIYASSDRRGAAVACCCFIILYFLVAYIPTVKIGQTEYPPDAAVLRYVDVITIRFYFVPLSGFRSVVFYFSPVVVLTAIMFFVPLRSINKIFSFILLGTLILLTLNEFSTFSLRQHLEKLRLESSIQER
jgi:TIR domain